MMTRWDNARIRKASDEASADWLAGNMGVNRVCKKQLEQMRDDYEAHIFKLEQAQQNKDLFVETLKEQITNITKINMQIRAERDKLQKWLAEAVPADMTDVIRMAIRDRRILINFYTRAEQIEEYRLMDAVIEWLDLLKTQEMPNDDIKDVPAEVCKAIKTLMIEAAGGHKPPYDAPINSWEKPTEFYIVEKWLQQIEEDEK